MSSDDPTTDSFESARARYLEAYELITGESFDEWFAPE